MQRTGAACSAPELGTTRSAAISTCIQTDNADLATLAKELGFTADLEDRIGEDKIDVIV